MVNPISSIKLVLVTGVSGAGHSTALKILEDYGFTAVDNLPLALVDPLIALEVCLLYTSPSPRDMRRSRMPSSA